MKIFESFDNLSSRKQTVILLGTAVALAAGVTYGIYEGVSSYDRENFGPNIGEQLHTGSSSFNPSPDTEQRINQGVLRIPPLNLDRIIG